VWFDFLCKFFNQTYTFLTDFRKNAQIPNCSMRMDGRTGSHDEAKSVSSQFCESADKEAYTQVACGLDSTSLDITQRPALVNRVMGKYLDQLGVYELFQKQPTSCNPLC
jgi:hypothetical protein